MHRNRGREGGRVREGRRRCSRDALSSPPLSPVPISEGTPSSPPSPSLWQTGEALLRRITAELSYPSRSRLPLSISPQLEAHWPFRTPVQTLPLQSPIIPPFHSSPPGKTPAVFLVNIRLVYPLSFPNHLSAVFHFLYPSQQSLHVIKSHPDTTTHSFSAELNKNLIFFAVYYFFSKQLFLKHCNKKKKPHMTYVVNKSF